MLNTIPIKKVEIQKPQQYNMPQFNNDNFERWTPDERSNILPNNFIKNNDNNDINKMDIDKVFIEKNEIVKDDNIINDVERKINENMDSVKIGISFSNKNKRFIIHESNNTNGPIYLHSIIKYLANAYDTEKQFMKNINVEEYEKSKVLIKKYIFNLQYNKKTTKSDIVIIEYTESGFMGDIYMLNRLNDLLFEYQKNELNNDLMAITNVHDRIKIEQNIKKFIYLLLNYTIRLIFIISEKIKFNKEMEPHKLSLLNYAIICSNRINIFVQEQLAVIYVCDKEIKKAYVTNMEIKNIIKSKLENITKEVVSEHKSDRIVFNQNDALNK